MWERWVTAASSTLARCFSHNDFGVDSNANAMHKCARAWIKKYIYRVTLLRRGEAERSLAIYLAVRVTRETRQEDCRFHWSELVCELGRGTCYVIVKACKMAPPTSPTNLPTIFQTVTSQLSQVDAVWSRRRIYYIWIFWQIQTTRVRNDEMYKHEIFKNLCLSREFINLSDIHFCLFLLIL